MRSARPGTRTSNVEVANISPNGIWLLVDGREHFLGFAEFPWFKGATIGEVLNVERPGPDHLYWPDLDVDLAVESLDHPERFPLVSRVGPDEPKARTRRRARRGDVRRTGSRRR